MGARTAISVEAYLHTSFPDLDCEYRDGEIIERSLPDYLHGETQLLIAAFFAALRKRLNIFPCTETRMKIRERRYIIPDVAVFWGSRPPLVPETPPLVAIEILSPDDRTAAVQSKAEEYKVWGVPHIWIVDPHARKMYRYDKTLIEVDSLKIPELGVEVTSADVFD